MYCVCCRVLFSLILKTKYNFSLQVALLLLPTQKIGCCKLWYLCFLGWYVIIDRDSGSPNYPLLRKASYGSYDIICLYIYLSYCLVLHNTHMLMTVLLTALQIKFDFWFLGLTKSDVNLVRVSDISTMSFGMKNRSKSILHLHRF